ncbi:hypothetical protein BJ138DRAFT_1208160, partial [Hygrophoropsis aurantiaca]
PPTDEEVQAFNCRDPGCIQISAENFRLDLSRSRNSPFNRQAKHVFAKDFINKVTQEKWYTHPSIPLRFLTHNFVECTLHSQMSNLKRSYREKVIPIGATRTPIRLQNSARSSRKGRLFTSRMQAMTKDPGLIQHIPLMTKLGNCTMSSDESEVEGDEKKFATVTPIWRSKELSAFLWRVDEAVSNQRIPKVGHNRVRGNPPRRRYRPSIARTSVKSTAPPGLPINCYDPVWRQNLREHDLMALQADPSIYHF